MKSRYSSCMDTCVLSAENALHHSLLSNCRGYEYYSYASYHYLYVGGTVLVRKAWNWKALGSVPSSSIFFLSPSFPPFPLFFLFSFFLPLPSPSVSLFSTFPLLFRLIIASFLLPLPHSSGPHVPVVPG